ncbi:MAG: CBS domain-containing protein [Myxococcales bacterium]|nr:CBS domain-containing protein [Myxococcales bacterium]
MKVVDSSSLLNQRGLLGKRARDIMTPMPLKVGPEDDVLDVVATMVREGVRHLPVVDADRRVIGIVSDRDLRTAIGDPIEALEHDDEEPQERWPIEAVMSRNPITAHVDASLAELAKCLVDERTGAVPIVDSEDRLVGIVSYVDLLHVAYVQGGG